MTNMYMYYVPEEMAVNIGKTPYFHSLQSCGFTSPDPLALVDMLME